MPELDRDQFLRIVRDAFYATVGAGVLTVQQLDKVRHQLAERLNAQYGAGRQQVEQLLSAVEGRMGNLDERMKVVEGQVDSLLDAVQERLPYQASDAFARARRVTADARRAATEASGRLTTRVRDTAA